MQKLGQELINFIQLNDMTESFWEHYESLDNGPKQLIFYSEVMALRIWTVGYTAYLIMENREDYSLLIVSIEDYIRTNLNPELLNLVLYRTNEYREFEDMDQPLEQAAAKFIENTKLDKELGEEAVQMLKAFIGKVNFTIREYY
ncbi:hypothetical protein [Peribacillus sp. SCS-155]|uniref:hypothetical protein n=1 Tax=Peribacillus sedimenti TaxID=3115297 RepID=UPI003906CE7A